MSADEDQVAAFGVVSDTFLDAEATIPPPGGDPGVKSEPPGASTDVVTKEEVETAVKNGVRAHTEYDRDKRKANGTIRMSKKNDNTKDSKVEHDIETLITSLDAKDKIIVEFEEEVSCGTEITRTMLREHAKSCEYMFGNIKELSKKCSGLKSLFKV